MQRFTVIIEPSDGEYFAYVPGLPGCTRSGKTQGEVIENIKESIQLTIDYLREHNLPIPDSAPMIAEVEIG